MEELFFREHYARAALLSQAFQRMRRRKLITMELGSMPCAAAAVFSF